MVMHFVAWPCKSTLGHDSLCKSVNDCHLVACAQKLAQLSVLSAEAKNGLIPLTLCQHYACDTLQEAVVHPQEEDPMDSMAADDASPASAVRERYERMFKEKQRGSKGAAVAGDPAAAALAAQGQAVRTAFQGSISSVFTKHLRQGGICYCCFVCCLQPRADATNLSPSTSSMCLAVF